MEWREVVRDGETCHVLLLDGHPVGEIYRVTGLHGEGLAWRGALAQAPGWPGFFPADDAAAGAAALDLAKANLMRSARFHFGAAPAAPPCEITDAMMRAAGFAVDRAMLLAGDHGRGVWTPETVDEAIATARAPSEFGRSLALAALTAALFPFDGGSAA